MIFRFVTTEIPDVQVRFHDIRSAEVILVSGTAFPERVLGTITRGYSGVYSISPPTIKEIEQAGEDLARTRLKTPLEFLQYSFLIQGVPRTFTHQLVRTRIGISYVQESMRFFGTHNNYDIMLKSSDAEIEDECVRACVVYHKKVSGGMPSEEARAVLPHAIMTDVFVGATISTLRNMYEQRMCCQAEGGVWQIVMKQIKDILIQQSPMFEDVMTAPYERGEPCGYRASFDRPCQWQK